MFDYPSTEALCADRLRELRVEADEDRRAQRSKVDNINTPRRVHDKWCLQMMPVLRGLTTLIAGTR